MSTRYFLRFRHSDTGLTPTFNFFKKVSDLTTVSPPSITEVGFGDYYFDYTPTFDITFEVDGGASIPTEEVRYIADTISPRDIYLDEPISQVKTDVWTDNTSYAAGQKGKRVDQLGDPTDLSSASTMFGKELLYKESIRGDSAGTSDGENVKLARDRIMGGTGYGGTGVDVKTVNDSLVTAQADLTAIKGSGFVSGTDSLKVLSDVLDSILGVGFVTGTDSLKVLSDILDLVKAKTDNLPIDPADASDVALAITNAVTSIKGAGPTDITQVKTVVDAINLKTTNLPTDPADASDVALAISNATTSIKGADSRDLTQLAGTGFVSATDSLAAISLGVGGGLTAGQVAVAVWDALLAAHTVPNSFGAKVATLALSSDVTTAVTTIQGTGGPTLKDMAGATFNTLTDSLEVTSNNLLRALGMLHENSVLDQTSFTVDNNLLTGRMRIYDSKANADAAKAASPGIYDTGKIAEYAVIATYTGTNLTTYKVTREA